MYDMNRFRRDYPLRTARIDGFDFPYRYYRNPDAKETLVLLTGGVGFSDLFYLHFVRFAREFSVLTFDYHAQYPTIGAFTDAAARLMEQLGITGWLVGQSMGGIVAQVFAQRHPEAVEGLVLSNTCPLTGDMGPEAWGHLMKLFKSQKLARFLVHAMPFSLYTRLCQQIFRKFQKKDCTREEAAILAELADEVGRLMNKPYELHMIEFMLDAIHYQSICPEDFQFCRGRILPRTSSAIN